MEGWREGADAPYGWNQGSNADVVSARWPEDAPASFEDPAHQVAVVNGIASGVLPLKYAYAGSAARTHDRLARSGGYRNVIGPATLEAGALAAVFAQSDESRDLVEIGPGNGLHTAALLAQLDSIGFPIERYLALDFSRSLLGLCRRTLAAERPKRPAVNTGLWDVESEPTSLIASWRADAGRLVVALLGQTVGNVENISSTLCNIHASMRPGDALAITVALRRRGAGDDALLEPYRTEVFRAALLEPLRAAGVAIDDLDLRLSVIDGTVIGEVEFPTQMSLSHQKLTVGHTVTCFRSRRFDATRLLDMFDQVNWAPLIVMFDAGGDHAVVVVSKRTGGE